MVGESLDTARYAGMNISKVIVIAMLISGGLCGVVGMIQASAIEKTLVAGIANNYGFTAIITAWLAKLNPASTLVVCFGGAERCFGCRAGADLVLCSGKRVFHAV